ncbi:MAG: hypothetical protein ACRDRH_16585 [Pseudonocardia sp.]
MADPRNHGVEHTFGLPFQPTKPTQHGDRILHRRRVGHDEGKDGVGASVTPGT